MGDSRERFVILERASNHFTLFTLFTLSVLKFEELSGRIVQLWRLDE